MSGDSATRTDYVTPTGFKQPVSETLPSVIARIVETLAPERVILFGSYAYGTPSADSDVDLLVVMETDSAPAERFLAVSRLVRPRPFPLDVVVKTPAEIRAAITSGDPFVAEILQQGRTLYERREVAARLLGTVEAEDSAVTRRLPLSRTRERGGGG